MTKGRKWATAMLAALAMAAIGAKAHAAQCGNGPGGFEAWKRQFAEEARAKGVGQTALGALMQTNYASATIAADRSLRSFKLSLDAFMIKRGSAAIVARGRSMKQSHAALFAEIERRYGVPPGPLIAIWGMETASAASAATKTCCRRSQPSPMTAAARSISRISSTRR